MTPQERQLVTDLFDRLSQLESAPRDRDAADAIQQGLRVAPNAIYPLVQTVLLQEEALKRANARIEELEAQAQGDGGAPQTGGGFLDNMRGALFGGQPSRGGTVPNVRPGERPAWNTAGAEPRGGPGFNLPPAGGAPQAGGAGGSFLGTAAAAAAGVIGGSMLMNSIGSLMGGGKHGFGDSASMGKGDSANPWSGGGDQKDSLSRDAGLNDIGASRMADSSNARSDSDGQDSRQGFFDQASYDDESDGDFGDDDFDSDDGDYV